MSTEDNQEQKQGREVLVHVERMVMLPCPFCGSPGRIEKIWQPEAIEENVVPSYTVGCPKIGCKGMTMYGVFGEKGILEEVRKWNTRKTRKSTAVGVLNRLRDSHDNVAFLKTMTDNQVSNALRELVWASTDMFSLNSDIIEEAIKRLKKRAT